MAVGEGHFEALAASAVEREHAGVGDLGDDGDVLVEREVGQRREPAALLVPARVVMQEITDRVQVEVLGHHLRGGTAEQLLQGFVERRHAIHCTPRQ